MEPLDRRTRRNTEVRAIGLDEFFNECLPRLDPGCRELAAQGVKHLGARPLILEVDGRRWTLDGTGQRLRAIEGDVTGGVAVRMSPEDASNWVQQQVTFTALMTAGRVEHAPGSSSDLLSWDAAWLALLEGWPTVDLDLSFLDRRGKPLDLGRAFTPDDDPRDIAHFFREAGYLHLRGWLRDWDLGAVAREIEGAVPRYREGDGRSWWATVDGGARRCVRLQHIVDHAPTIAELLASPTWDAVRTAIGGDVELRPPVVEGNVIEALVKPLAVVEGVSDVPWHRDCSFGRHAYQCAGVVAGISVDPGNEARGQLRVVAGSHRVAMPAFRANRDPYLPVMAVPTERGDVTVHQSCTLHESTPPLSEGDRMVMYTGFGLPVRDDLDGTTPQAEAIRSLREGAHRMRSQPRSPVAGGIGQSN